MMLEVLVQTGLKFKDEITYAVIMTKEKQFAIQKNHMPIIANVTDGYIKIISGDHTSFIYVSQGLIKYQDAMLKCYALSAEIGNSQVEALKNHNANVYEHKNASKKENIDYSKLEKELRDNIISAGAGHL